MTESIIVLTEVPLVETDAHNLATFAEGGDMSFIVIVPTVLHRNMLADFLDNLSLLDFAEAFRDLNEGQPDPRKVEMDAQTALASSLAVMSAAGLQAVGEVTSDDPVPALINAVRAHDAQQCVVITTPHAVADTFRQDWANRAQDKLGVPVLHLYSGSGFIGDS
ncbi:hypothetical protein [Arthrobacter roseus]|uniref:hypothetical protein n=1 Tax=Arthrobacter roseus TaxID=136274 RepID=UPI001964053B|nr:hypothetical protein [Arthrobacter roseus]MBM7848405.1 hypothetical protein [Arthrobacter roseus]